MSKFQEIKDEWKLVSGKMITPMLDPNSVDYLIELVEKHEVSIIKQQRIIEDLKQDKSLLEKELEESEGRYLDTLNEYLDNCKE